MRENDNLMEQVEDLENRIETLEAYISESSFSGYYLFEFDNTIDMLNAGGVLLGKIRPLLGLNKVDVIILYDSITNRETTSSLVIGGNVIARGIISNSSLGATNFLIGNMVIDGEKSIYLNYDNESILGSISKIRLYIKGDVVFSKNA